MMKAAIYQFTFRLAMLTLMLAVVIYGAKYLIPGDYLTPALPWLLIFFLFFTALVHYILLLASQKDGRKFLNYFMIATFLKFIVYISLIFGYIFINKDDILNFGRVT